MGDREGQHVQTTYITVFEGFARVYLKPSVSSEQDQLSTSLTWQSV